MCCYLQDQFVGEEAALHNDPNGRALIRQEAGAEETEGFNDDPLAACESWACDLGEEVSAPSVPIPASRFAGSDCGLEFLFDSPAEVLVFLPEGFYVSIKMRRTFESQ